MILNIAGCRPHVSCKVYDYAKFIICTLSRCRYIHNRASRSPGKMQYQPFSAALLKNPPIGEDFGPTIYVATIVLSKSPESCEGEDAPPELRGLYSLVLTIYRIRGPHRFMDSSSDEGSAG